MSHTVKRCLFTFDGSNIDVEQQSGLQLERVNQIIKCIEFRFKDSQPLFHYAAFIGVVMSIHFFYAFAHHGNFFPYGLFLINECTVHFFNFGFRRANKRNFIPYFGNIFVCRRPVRNFVLFLNVFFVERCQISKIRNAPPEAFLF